MRTIKNELLLEPKYNFEDVFPLKDEDVTRITATEGCHALPGDIILVRSIGVPDLGDHFIVVTGAPIMKEQGLRPQVIALPTIKDTILNKYEAKVGYTLLKLKHFAKQAFMEFYGITMDCNKVSYNVLQIERAE